MLYISTGTLERYRTFNYETRLDIEKVIKERQIVERVSFSLNNDSRSFAFRNLRTRNTNFQSSLLSDTSTEPETGVCTPGSPSAPNCENMRKHNFICYGVNR